MSSLRRFFTIVIFSRTAFLVSSLPPRISPQSLIQINQTLTPDLALPSNYSEAPPVPIEQCGSRTSEVERVLLALQRAATFADAIVPAGVDIPAYKAMFKENAGRARVSSYFDAIKSYQGLIAVKPTPFQPTTPRVACVTANSDEIYRFLDLGYDPWQRCAVPIGGAPKEVFRAEGTAYVFLCPSFFQQPLAPFGSKCPTVEQNLFRGDGGHFVGNYQMYTLLYGFLRLYLGTSSLDESSNPRETFNWNTCIAYSLLTSIRNPINYVLYTALLEQRCTDIPDPRKPPFTDGLSSNPTNISSPAVAES